MTHLLPRMAAAAQGKLHTTVGRRFRRFAVAAVAAVVASQTTLAVLLGGVGWTAGRSALAAWVAGAGTSYLVSRWAWERKGRPHLLKETVPFWIVAVFAAIVLTTTTKIANQRGIAMGLSHTQQLIFVGAAYFVANCVTFVTRFVIFHYVVFKDLEAKLEAPAAAADPAACRAVRQARRRPPARGRWPSPAWVTGPAMARPRSTVLPGPPARLGGHAAAIARPRTRKRCQRKRCQSREPGAEPRLEQLRHPRTWLARAGVTWVRVGELLQRGQGCGERGALFAGERAQAVSEHGRALPADPLQHH